MTVTSLLVCKLVLDKSTRQLTALDEPYKLVLPKVQSSDNIEPCLLLLDKNSRETRIPAAKVAAINGPPGCLAFYTQSLKSKEREFFWIADSNLSNADLICFIAGFDATSKAFWSMNLSSKMLLKHANLFGEDFNKHAQNPYFQDTAAVVETCLQKDPGLVDYEYAVFLQSRPEHFACLYDYMVFLNNKNKN